MDWLPRVSEPAVEEDVEEDIVRSLSVPWAPPTVARLLVGEYQRSQDDTGIGLKWAIGNALSIVAGDEVFPDLVALAIDRRNGKAREMMVVALGNMRDPRAVDVLTSLLADPEVSGHALIALGKLRAGAAHAAIARFLTHPSAWIRQEAARALKRIASART